jgi:hypothetical protein
MKATRIAQVLIPALMIAACNASKKSVTSATSSTPSPAPSFVYVKPATGIHPPGNEELTAIQLRFKDVTLNKLKEGYNIYTEGACVNCHGAKNIYNREEALWKGIMDDMAPKAKITDAQKDAVYQYVLSIKATQLK